MNWILALQKELGSVRGLPEDMQYVRNAMIILSEMRKEQKAAQPAAVCPDCGNPNDLHQYDCPHWQPAAVRTTPGGNDCPHGYAKRFDCPDCNPRR